MPRYKKAFIFFKKIRLDLTELYSSEKGSRVKCSSPSNTCLCNKSLGPPERSLRKVSLSFITHKYNCRFENVPRIGAQVLAVYT